MLALDSLLRIRQVPGPVLADAASGRVAFFPAPDPGGRWIGFGIRYATKGAWIAVPAPHRVAWRRSWLVPPDGSGALFGAAEWNWLCIRRSACCAAQAAARRACPMCGGAERGAASGAGGECVSRRRTRRRGSECARRPRRSSAYRAGRVPLGQGPGGVCPSALARRGGCSTVLSRPCGTNGSEGGPLRVLSAWDHPATGLPLGDERGVDRRGSRGELTERRRLTVGLREKTPQGVTVQSRVRDDATADRRTTQPCPTMTRIG